MSEPTKEPATKADLDAHEKHEELSLAKLLSTTVGRIFRREALLTLGVLLLGAGGALYGRAWAQTALDGGVAKQLAPVVTEQAAIKTEQAAIKTEQAAIKTELAAVRIEVATTRAGVEMLLRAQGLVPPRSIHPDGGP